MNIELSILLAMIGSFGVIVTLIINTKNNNKTDGVTQGKISNDLEYMKRGIDTVMLEMKDQARETARLKESLLLNKNETLKALENAERAYKHAENAHNRINKIGGIK